MTLSPYRAPAPVPCMGSWLSEQGPIQPDLFQLDLTVFLFRDEIMQNISGSITEPKVGTYLRGPTINVL